MITSHVLGIVLKVVVNRVATLVEKSLFGSTNQCRRNEIRRHGTRIQEQWMLAVKTAAHFVGHAGPGRPTPGERQKLARIWLNDVRLSAKVIGGVGTKIVVLLITIDAVDLMFAIEIVVDARYYAVAILISLLG